MRTACIGLDARKYFDLGIGTYIRNLVTSYAELASPHRFVLFVSEEDASRIGAPMNCRIVKVPYGKYSLSELFLFAPRLRREHIDLFHSPHYTLPFGLGRRSVVTIHDLIHLHFLPAPSIAKRFYARAIIRHAVRSAGVVVTDSQFTKSDLLQTIGGDPGKICVIPLAVSAAFRRLNDPARLGQLRERFSISGPFLLYTGSVKPHKNLEMLLSAFSALSREYPALSLVTVGERLSQDHLLAEKIRREDLNGRIRELGYLSEEDLVTIYNAAFIHVLPSVYEGFGLPVLEAMACGAPVVAANAGSIPETAGGAALLFNPVHERSLEEALRNVLSNESLRTDLITRGLGNVQRFSWLETARLTLKVYQSLLD